VFGALSDRIGRRAVYALGYSWVAVGFILLPLAESLPQLIAARAFISVGVAATGSMLATVLADYPQNQSRGKLVAVAGMCNGLGAFAAVLLLSRLPSLFASLGYDTLVAGRLSYGVAAIIALGTAFIIFFGLKPGAGAIVHKGVKLVVLLRQGLQATRANKRLIVAYIEGFAARGDLVVIGTFFSLWAKQAGLDQGLTLEDAVKQAGLYAAIIQGSILCWAPVWGLILDRIDRLTAVCIAMLVAACGYMLVGLSSSPVGLAFIPAALLLGCGEVGAILSGQALVGQEAPEELRGSVIGLFMLAGGIGLLSIGVIGGWIFDAWMPGGVFIVVACGNVIVLIYALLVRFAELRQTD
jgi:MFS family permease